MPGSFPLDERHFCFFCSLTIIDIVVFLMINMDMCVCDTMMISCRACAHSDDCQWTDRIDNDDDAAAAAIEWKEERDI